jgi:predicted amidohydrolase
VRVAAIQHDIVWEDAGATRALVTPMIREAAAAGARLIVLSEMFATGFSMRPDRIAEDEGGPSERLLLDQAAEHGAWLIASIAQRGEDGLFRNNAIVAGPDGSVRRYAKIHPFSYAGEHEVYAAGDRFLTLDVEGLRVTVFVCYDLRFADEFWACALDTDVYVVPANWPAARREHWSILLRARAVENQAYVIGVNRVGSGGGLDYAGDTVVIDPLGRTSTTDSDEPSVLLADVDASVVSDTRRDYRFLPDRR